MEAAPKVQDESDIEALKKLYAGQPQKPTFTHVWPSCPNCGYCPHCGRGSYPWTPTYPPYTPFPSQVWCVTNGN